MISKSNMLKAAFLLGSLSSLPQSTAIEFRAIAGDGTITASDTPAVKRPSYMRKDERSAVEVDATGAASSGVSGAKLRR